MELFISLVRIDPLSLLISATVSGRKSLIWPCNVYIYIYAILHPEFKVKQSGLVDVQYFNISLSQ